MKRICLPRILCPLAVCLSVFCTATAFAQTRPADSAASYVKRGNWWFEQGDLDRAITDFDMAIAFDPNAAAAYYNRGCVRQAKGDGDRALADYRRATEINPRHGAAYNNSCGIYFVQGRLDEAIAACNRAIEIDPRFASAYCNRGIAREGKGDLDGALADYNTPLNSTGDLRAPTQGAVWFGKQEETWMGQSRTTMFPSRSIPGWKRRTTIAVTLT